MGGARDPYDQHWAVGRDLLNHELRRTEVAVASGSYERAAESLATVVGVYREFTAADAFFEDRLALALIDLAWCLECCGRRTDALEKMVEAAGIYSRLPDHDPERGDLTGARRAARKEMRRMVRVAWRLSPRRRGIANFAAFLDRLKL